MFSDDTLKRKHRLLDESYAIIERLKKLRALNANPRDVGINLRLRGLENRFIIMDRKRI